MSDLLLARARQQDGVFTTADARAVGISGEQLARLVRRDDVVRVGPRAYVTAEAVAAANSDRSLHRLRVLATVAASDGRQVASHHSALAVYDMPFWKAPAGTLHMARIHGRSTRRAPGIEIHESYLHKPIRKDRHPRRAGDKPPAAVLRPAITNHEARRVFERGIVVAPALAVVGNAMLNGEESGVVVADEALRREMTTLEDLHDTIAWLCHQPGLAAARRAIGLADGRSGSIGESRLRLIMGAMPDLPAFELQAEFRDGPDEDPWAYADFRLGRRVIVEFDGRKKYQAAKGRNAKEIEDIVWAEKNREDRIRRQGYVVVRFTWAELNDPVAVGIKLRAALADAARIWPEDVPLRR